MRVLIAICLFLTLSAQLQAQTNNETLKRIRNSLIYLEATAETDTGVPLQSTATGFIVTPQGRVLTVNHLIEQLINPANALHQGHVNPATIQIRAHVGYKQAPPMIAEVVNSDKIRDLLVLSLPSKPEVYAAVCAKIDLDPQIQEDVGTAGFPEVLQYQTGAGKVTSPDGPNGTWITDLIFNPGQSGSPVFIPSGAVVGIAKGQIKGSDNLPMPGINVVVPIADALSLEPHLTLCKTEPAASTASGITQTKTQPDASTASGTTQTTIVELQNLPKVPDDATPDNLEWWPTWLLSFWYDARIIIDRGSEQGTKPGDNFVVIRSSEIKTAGGESLGVIQQPGSRIRVVEAQPKFSICQLEVMAGSSAEDIDARLAAIKEDRSLHADRYLQLHPEIVAPVGVGEKVVAIPREEMAWREELDKAVKKTTEKGIANEEMESRYATVVEKAEAYLQDHSTAYFAPEVLFQKGWAQYQLHQYRASIDTFELFVNRYPLHASSQGARDYIDKATNCLRTLEERRGAGVTLCAE